VKYVGTTSGSKEVVRSSVIKKSTTRVSRGHPLTVLQNSLVAHLERKGRTYAEERESIPTRLASTNLSRGVVFEVL
jgi:hypothetical protein